MTSKEKIITISIQSRGNRIEFQDLFPRLRVLSQYQTAVLRALSDFYRRTTDERAPNKAAITPLIHLFYAFFTFIFMFRGGSIHVCRRERKSFEKIAPILRASWGKSIKNRTSLFTLTHWHDNVKWISSTHGCRRIHMRASRFLINM